MENRNLPVQKSQHKNKVKDPEIKKAVEVALDLGGAFDIAGKEIQKFYGRKIRNSKEVKKALQFANESFEIKEGKSLKQLKSKYKKDVKNYNNNRDISQEAAMAFAYWAIKNGEIKTDDPDEFDQWLDDNLSEGTDGFLDKLVKIQFNSSDPEQAEKILIKAAKKGLLGYNGPMKHGGIVGNDSFIVVGKEKDVDKVLNSMRKIMSSGRKLLNMPKISLVQYNSFDYGEGKSLMEASAFAVMQDIVKDKQAKKIKGTMVDMFTASVVVKAYDKVNDSNKKKIEKAPLETLVKLAHKVMGMKEEDELDEWISKDGARRRVAEKDQRKNVKEGDDSLGAKKFQKPLKDKKYPHQEQLNVMDTFRNMVEKFSEKSPSGKRIVDFEVFLDSKDVETALKTLTKNLKKDGLSHNKQMKNVKGKLNPAKGKDDVIINAIDEEDRWRLIVIAISGSPKYKELDLNSSFQAIQKLKSAEFKAMYAEELTEAPALPSVQSGDIDLEKTDHTIDAGVVNYVVAINKQIKSGQFAKLHKEKQTELKARKASKYYRLEMWEMGRAASIHAFVEISTGDIFKPAGWKAPAKGARGNITDNRYIDFVARYPSAYHGGHLYK